MPHSTVSDLGLHCLPMSLLWDARLKWVKNLLIQIQSNLNGLNTDGSFSMAYSNSFLSPFEILQIAQKTNI